ncbi:YeeE/YedE family protein [Aquabacterium lacunae]|uniref:YeeE/YedE family protein n=1 Tax=Aquabacterium lacunae TaxID=2528630 RepID=A0A4Q9H5Z8_9BURK|nr:YeeE/YedE family protein [Aquabacterium lacunae]TBO34007.1 YeeE/YedE family protein [Aquabacterium lacunae]
MTIDWTHFTPWASLAGGVLIGLSAVMLAAFHGRIAGISGIVGGLLTRQPGPVAWRLAFIGGLLLAPWLWRAGQPWPASTPVGSWPLLVAAGLLVGIGTRYGSGCTSGHGVCGLSRLSPRSLVATLSFMALGFVTVYVMRHLMAAA